MSGPARFAEEMSADGYTLYLGQHLAGSIYADNTTPAGDIEIAAEIASRWNAHRDLLAACERAERKLSAYVGVCKGDKELTDTVLPMCEAAILKAKGGAL